MTMIFLTALGMGLVTELVAYKLKFWLYLKPSFLIFNILVMFVLVHGGIACLSMIFFEESPYKGLITAGAIGSVVGICYELFNEKVSRLFHFNEEGIYFLRSKESLILGVGIAWGGISVGSGLMYLLFV